MTIFRKYFFLTGLKIHDIIYIDEKRRVITLFDIEEIISKLYTGDVIGRGVGREAIAISDKVIAKVSHNGDDLNQSLHEISFYEKNEDKYGKYMAKMYGYFRNLEGYGTVLFMERVQPINRCVRNFLEKNYEPLGERGMQLCDEKMEEIIEFEEALQLEDSSENTGNWGVNENGDLVVLDCGLSYDSEFYHYRDEEFCRDSDYYDCSNWGNTF
jgi:hypothetical protein